jgi:hypothetical protein
VDATALIVAVVALVIGTATLWFAFQGVQLQRNRLKPEIGFWMHSANGGEVVLYFVNRGDVTITALYLGIESGNARLWTERLTMERGAVVSRVITIPSDQREQFENDRGYTFELVAEFDAAGHPWRAYQDTSKIDKLPRLARVLE